MALLRAAFERNDGITELVVLCAGCFRELLERLASDHKHWSRVLDCGVCEFCLDEVKRSALGG